MRYFQTGVCFYLQAQVKQGSRVRAAASGICHHPRPSERTRGSARRFLRLSLPLCLGVAPSGCGARVSVGPRGTLQSRARSAALQNSRTRTLVPSSGRGVSQRMSVYKSRGHQVALLGAVGFWTRTRRLRDRLEAAALCTCCTVLVSAGAVVTGKESILFCKKSPEATRLRGVQKSPF